MCAVKVVSVSVTVGLPLSLERNTLVLTVAVILTTAIVRSTLGLVGREGGRVSSFGLTSGVWNTALDHIYHNVNLKLSHEHFLPFISVVFGGSIIIRAIFPRVYHFLLRESVHTVKIEGRMVSVDVMSVCVLETLFTSTESASIK